MTKRNELVTAEVVDSEHPITRTQEDIVEAEAHIDPRVEGLARDLHAVYIKRLSVRSRPSVPLHFNHLNSEERASWEAVAEYIING